MKDPRKTTELLRESQSHRESAHTSVEPTATWKGPEEDLQRILALDRDLSSGTLQRKTVSESLAHCVDALVRHLGVALARIWMLNERDGVLELCASAGLYTHIDGEHGRIRMGELKIGLIAQERLPHLTNAVIGDPRVPNQEWARREGLVSFAGYPLLAQDRLLGVVAVFARRPLAELILQAMSSVALRIAYTIDHLRAEEMLRNSELKYRRLHESMMDAVASADMAGHILECNPAFETMVGYTAEELRKMTYRDLTPDRWDEFEDRIVSEQVMTCGHSEVYEKEYRRRDGTVFPVELRVFLLRDEGGQPNGMWAIIRDITERKRAEQALRESRTTVERQLHEIEAIYAAAPVGLAVLDRELRWIRLNNRMAEIDGYSVEEHLGRSCFELLPDLTPQIEPLMRRVIETGQPVLDVELSGTTHAQPGVDRTWIVSYYPLSALDGGTAGVNAVVKEITEWKRAEASLRENAIRQSLILEAGSSAVWEWDIQTGRAIFSATHTKFLGYDPEAFVSTYDAWKALLHPEDVDRVEQHIADHFAGRTDYSIELRMKERSGNWHWILSRGMLIERDSGGKPQRMVGTHVDIQPRKRAEEERENLQRQLAHAQKMESIGRLAGGLAHDFNNIMSVILLNADSALQETEEGAKDSLVAIQDAAEKAVALGQQLMTFSSKQAQQAEVLSLNSIVSDCEKMVRRLIGEDVKVVFRPGENLPSVRADRGQLAQIIMNLAVNARDAMPEGGTFVIESAAVEFDTADAQLNPEAPSGPYVMLSIRDTGIGMDDQTQARLFEPFFTTKGIGKGTGLGLSVIYGIVKQSGGFIRVVSERGHGTEFRIYLPAELGPPEPIVYMEESPVQGGSETILLVEDEPALRQKITEMLEKAGYAVLGAADGEQAHRLASRDTRPIHLLVTDVVMPGISGPQLAERLLTARPQMKVLYISGYPHASSGSAQPLRLQTGFLQKPFTREGLLRRLRESLDEP